MSVLSPRALALAAERDAKTLNDSRWLLAVLAANARRDNIPGWAEVIAACPSIRKSPRTIREWAQAAEFRQALPRQFDLPFSFYARASRYLDRLDIEDILDALEIAEQNRDVDLDGFTTALAQQCKDYNPKPVTLPIWTISAETIQRLAAQDRETRIVVLVGIDPTATRVKVKAIRERQ